MNANICPIVNVGATPPHSCPIQTCQHSRGTSCAYDLSSSLEGNVLAVSEAYMVSPVEVQDSISNIQALVLASRWFTHHTGENLLDATSSLIQMATSDSCLPEFVSWNTSSYSWENVVEALRSLQSKNRSTARC